MGRDRSVHRSSFSEGVSPALASNQVRAFRILCVDDDEENLSLRGTILRRHGYPVALDSSPLRTLQRNVLAFDLAIVDYEMPEMNGVELLYAMRARSVAYPIILLSGRLQSLDPSEQRLFYRCFDKGQSIEALLSVVAAYVQTSQLPDYGADGLPRFGNRMLR